MQRVFVPGQLSANRYFPNSDGLSGDLATHLAIWRNLKVSRQWTVDRLTHWEANLNSGLNESEIIEGLRNGCRRAWTALCAEYGGQLWRYISRLSGNDENVVADLFQDTLLAVARSGRSIREDTKLWSWLSRIGHNQTALYWRKKSRERTVSLASESPETSVECEGTDRLERTEKINDVRRLMSEMNAEYVALLVSKYVDGKTVSQIIDTLGGTNESVRSKLARARRDFRQRYEKLDGESQEPPELRNWISNEGN